MNQKLEAISAKACSDLSALVKEAEEKILEAMHTCAEEAEDQDSHPKFRLGFTVTLDMDADKMESALSFSIRRKLTTESSIPDPDPNQSVLPGIAADVVLTGTDTKAMAQAIMDDAAKNFGRS